MAMASDVVRRANQWDRRGGPVTTGSPTLSTIPHRDPETGQFMSGSGGESTLMSQQLPGLGSYHDIEQITFQHNTLINASGTDDFNTAPDDVVVDFDQLLDRRSELADMLHLEVRYLLECTHTLGTQEGEINRAYGEGYLRANAGDEFDNIIPREPYETNPDFGDDVVSDDSYDILHAPIAVQSYSPFADPADPLAGGGGGASDGDLVKKGWHLADPTFDSRDEIQASSRIQIAEGTLDVRTTLTGQMLFGVYDSSHATG